MGPSAQSSRHRGAQAAGRLCPGCSYLMLDEEGLFPLAQKHSVAPGKHLILQEAGCCKLLPSKWPFLLLALPPDNSELLLSALPFFLPERATKPECPSRVSATKGAHVGVENGHTQAGTEAHLSSLVWGQQ